MKKANVINLIKYHAEGNDAAFRSESYSIASDFNNKGDYQLAEYIMSLMSSAGSLVPQEFDCESLDYLVPIDAANTPLPLPSSIASDVKGTINAISHRAGVNKFLFQGPPGTGKTEAVKQVARILNRKLFLVDFDELIDSKLGQTGKNLSALFREIRSLPDSSRFIILFDEIDAIALDRVDGNDVREMGRVTSKLLRELDGLDSDTVVFATTNLFSRFDKALARRFDACVNFDRYSNDDLVAVGESVMGSLYKDFGGIGRDMRAVKKILRLPEYLPYPGELKNILRTAVAFSDPAEEFDYLQRLYESLTGQTPYDLKRLSDEGFTVREIERLTGVSKSSVGRELSR